MRMLLVSDPTEEGDWPSLATEVEVSLYWGDALSNDEALSKDDAGESGT